MEQLGFVLLAAAAVLFLLAAIWVCYMRLKMRRILEHMGNMLDAAADGSFQEEVYDESLLSSVETKLAHFLAASKMSEKNHAQEQENVKQLIADISHQTKTPVANLLLYAQMLEEKSLLLEEHSFVEEINRQAKKLDFLIVSLVKASRLESGMIVLCPKMHAVGPMLEETIGQVAPQAEAKGLLVEFKAGKMHACFDYKWTAEAVYNILDNAVKYTPDGGKIEVSLLDTELFVRIEVRDTGIGIPEEELGKVFRRFYRSPSASGYEGAGIGLYLSRKIITEENGYMKVKSKVGGGSSFYVYLPNKKGQ